MPALGPPFFSFFCRFFFFFFFFFFLEINNLARSFEFNPMHDIKLVLIADKSGSHLAAKYIAIMHTLKHFENFKLAMLNPPHFRWHTSAQLCFEPVNKFVDDIKCLNLNPKALCEYFCRH